MSKANVLAVCIASVLGAIAMQVQAGPQCDVDGSYGYVYDGVSYEDGGAAVEIAETGSFSVGSESCGKDVEVCGTAKATFRFPNFLIPELYDGPLWALVELDFASADAVSVDPADPCQGTVDFVANGTVIESAPIDLSGVQLIVDQERSIAYTVSGSRGEIIDLISTSPGSILAGTGKRQKR